MQGLTTLHSGSEEVSGRWFLVREMPYFGQRDSDRTRDLAVAVKTNDTLFLDFLRRCLEWDPNDRMTPEDALRNEWILEVRALAETFWLLSSDILLPPFCLPFPSPPLTPLPSFLHPPLFPSLFFSFLLFPPLFLLLLTFFFSSSLLSPHLSGSQQSFPSHPTDSPRHPHLCRESARLIHSPQWPRRERWLQEFWNLHVRL